MLPYLEIVSIFVSWSVTNLTIKLYTWFSRNLYISCNWNIKVYKYIILSNVFSHKTFINIYLKVINVWSILIK